MFRFPSDVGDEAQAWGKCGVAHGEDKTYPGSIDRRGKTLRLRLCVGGKYHTFKLPTRNRKRAEEFAKDKYEELKRAYEREQLGLPTSAKVSQLFDQFEEQCLPTLAAGTQEAYRDSLKPIRKFFVEELENPNIEQVQTGHVRRFLEWRRVNRLGKRSDTLSNRTLQKDRAVLHRVFDYAEEMEYREGNPVAKAKAPDADERQPMILTDDEFEKLLEACEGRPMLRLYVLALNETGGRCESEILRLRWEDVDLEGGFLLIRSGREGHRTKSGRSRWVPMTPRLRQAMRAHFAAYRFAAYDGKPTPWVFHHEFKRARHKSGDRIGSLYDAFKKAAERAKLPKEVVQHDLRHRRVTTWLAEGENAVHVKEAVGHSDLRTTMGYTHLAREHLRSLVETTATGEAQAV